MQLHKPLLLALVAAVVAPAAAHAQPAPFAKDLPFTTISQGNFGGQQTASNKVIKTRADYDAFFSGQAPTSPSVDFNVEDVLALSMGAQSFGHGINVQRIELMTGGFTGGMAFVHYVETSLPPGTIVPAVMTSPVHVVKVAKGAASYVFTKDAAPQKFSALEFTYTKTVASYNATLKVSDAGALELYQSSPTAKFAPVTGTATAAELTALQKAFADADAPTLPTVVPDPRMFIVAPDSVELKSTIGTQTYSFSAHLDYYGGATNRVKPLLDLLTKIRERLLNPAPAPAFEKLSVASVGGFVLFSQTTTIAKDGTVTVNRHGVRAGFADVFLTGQAKPAELKAVQDAFALADPATLPKTINVPQMIMDIPSNVIESTIGAKTYSTTVVKAGFYGSYEKRLKPLVDALNDIADRLVTASQDRSYSGKVSVTAGKVFVGTRAIDAGSPVFKVLKASDGRSVKITADVLSGNLVSAKSVNATALQNVNVRENPVASAKAFDTAKAGETLKVTGLSPNGLYYQVDRGGQQGWVYRPFVSVGK